MDNRVTTRRNQPGACCPDKGANNDASFPLSFGSAGEALCISRVPAGKGIAERLAAMGIQQGDRVQVVQNQGGYMLIETAAGLRFVIGGGMADKIFATRG